MEIMGKELSHAAQCMEIYVRNERDIYERYTVPAIECATKNAQLAGRFINWAAYPHIVADWDTVNGAIQAAARMVKKYDGMKPTAEDIETVRAGYVADIIDKAKYEIKRQAEKVRQIEISRCNRIDRQGKNN